LFYGVLGYSQLDYEIPVLDDSISTSGISYGVGVDFAATDMFIVGLEYLARNTDGDSFFVGQTADIDVDTVSLRLGLSF
jgi:opacity protein-like surface antigen